MTSSILQDQWLPLNEAAERISESTNQKHSIPFLLRRALNGLLTLSVQISTPEFARSGFFQDREEETYNDISPCTHLFCCTNGEQREKNSIWEKMGIENKVFVYSQTKGEHIDGVLDFLLIGNGRDYIDNLARKAIGESEICYLPLGGIYLKGTGESFWEIQEEILNPGDPQYDVEYKFFPAERIPDEWRIVVRSSEVERFSNEVIKETRIKKIAHQQYAEKKEQFEIQKILSQHQPTEVDLISPEELREDHGISVKKALRLGTEGKLRFFSFIKYATIVFGDIIEASKNGEELFDPQYCLDVDKGFYFQVAPETLREILQSSEGITDNHVQLVFPEALKSKTEKWVPDGQGVRYKTRIESNFNLWPELSQRLKISEDEHLVRQRWRTIENLCVLKEDITAYERELAKYEQQPTTDQAAAVVEQSNPLQPDIDAVEVVPDANGKILGHERLCGAFNCQSFTSVKNRVDLFNKKYPYHKIEFQYSGRSPYLLQKEILLINLKLDPIKQRKSRKKE